MDGRTIARWRLHTMGLAGRSLPSPTAVVDHLLGVQAENPVQSRWAVGARTDRATEADVARLLDEGAILRTHVLRPTWHYVRPDDIRWLVELTGERVRRPYAVLAGQLGLEPATIERAVEVVVASLAEAGHLVREQVGARLADAGLPCSGQQLGVVLAFAELGGLICSGPTVDGEHSYAPLDARAPGARTLDREDALAEIARRYVVGHGPVTARDLAYWATLTLRDARRGLDAVGEVLGRFTHDGQELWHATDPPPPGPLEPLAHLLQTLDEYHNGVQDSRGVLDVDGLVPPGRPPSVGMVLLDGQLVGRMWRRTTATEVVFEVALLRRVDAEEDAAVEDAAARYGAFLDLPARVVARASGG